MPMKFHKTALLCTGLLIAACQSGEDGDDILPVSEGNNLCLADLADECRSLQAYADEQSDLQNSSMQRYAVDELLAYSIEVDHANNKINLYSKGFTPSSAPIQQENQRYEYMKSLINPNFDDVGNFTQCAAGAACEEYKRQNTALRSRLDELVNKQSEEALRLRINTNMTVLKANSEPQNLLLDRAYSSVMSFLANAERMKIGSDSEIDTNVIDPSQCPRDLQADCQNIFELIAQLNADRLKSLGDQNDTRARELSLQINYNYDLLQTLMGGNGPDSDAYRAIEQRYYALQIISDAGLKGYSIEEQNEVRKVTNLYGDLKIKPTLDEDGNAEWQGIELTDDRPWSGYWYPFRYKDMFNGLASDSFKKNASPLESFDRILESLGREPGAAEWEKKRQRSNVWESSDGLCDAWSVAAALTPEPNQSFKYEGVKLTPSHIKGLLVQKYSNYRKDRFGISYQGFIDTDGLGQDLRPEAFHQLVTNMISEKKAPIVDTDPNFPIWNMPMFKYEWKVVDDPENKNAYLVTARAWYAKFRNKETNELTNYQIGRGSDVYLPTYKYRLYFDSREAGDEKTIIYGEWIIDRAAGEHPDTVFMVKNGEDENIGPRNPFVAENLDVLNEILLQAQ